MATLVDQIMGLLAKQGGLTDREITDSLRGKGAPQQAVNQAARFMESRRLLSRTKRPDGKIGNYLAGKSPKLVKRTVPGGEIHGSNELSEDRVKEILAEWLKSDGWEVQVAWGHARGIDIDAMKGRKRWIIEVKGIGSRQPMRVNYFIGMLGETLQRMDDPGAMYSIAMPDVTQFRGLWQRLPELAKKRTGISALFVASDGGVQHHMWHPV